MDPANLLTTVLSFIALFLLLFIAIAFGSYIVALIGRHYDKPTLLWGGSYVFAGILDLVDMVTLPLSGIPFLGDIIDLGEMLMLIPLIGKYALFGAVEFIPGADILPMNTLAVVFAHKEWLGDPMALDDWR